MSDYWDRFKTPSGTWVTFKEPGDQVIGRIIELREGKDFNKNPCPELVIDKGDGTSVVLTAGQKMLQIALMEKAPMVGDRIRIVYTGNGEPRQAGQQAPKMFTVDVKTQADHEISPF